MITPKPFGLNSSMSFFNLSRSFLLLIFCETEIRLDKGIKTKNLPAKESSELILGPLVEIGSFIIWVRMVSFGDNTSSILPCLSISFSKFSFSSE